MYIKKRVIIAINFFCKDCPKIQTYYVFTLSTTLVKLFSIINCSSIFVIKSYLCGHSNILQQFQNNCADRLSENTFQAKPTTIANNVSISLQFSMPLINKTAQPTDYFQVKRVMSSPGPQYLFTNLLIFCTLSFKAKLSHMFHLQLQISVK